MRLEYYALIEEKKKLKETKARFMDDVCSPPLPIMANWAACTFNVKSGKKVN